MIREEGQGGQDVHGNGAKFCDVPFENFVIVLHVQYVKFVYFDTAERLASLVLQTSINIKRRLRSPQRSVLRDRTG